MKASVGENSFSDDSSEEHDINTAHWDDYSVNTKGVQRDIWDA